MRKVAAVMLLVGSLSGSAMAGTVLFSPATQTVLRGESVEVGITIEVDGTVVTTISGADIVIGSDVPFDFSYSSAWTTAMPNLTTPLPALGVYPNDLLVGGSNSLSGAGTSVSLGSLMINTVGLADGTYEVYVDSALDGGFTSVFRGLPGQTFVSEGLTGRGAFTVVPEPATLSLLGLGLVGLIRRRFVA